MAPNHLQGLNLVPPPPDATQPHNPNDLLGGTAPFPDLAAQLDLWTNLAFEPEDGSPPSSKTEPFRQEEEEEPQTPATDVSTRAAAIRAGHANVVTGTPVPSPADALQQQQQQQRQQIDFNAILAGFMHPAYPGLGQQQMASTADNAVQNQNQLTLSQLLALGPQQQQDSSIASSNGPRPPAQDEPPSKRSRTSARKDSISNSTSSPSSSSTAAASSPSNPKEDQIGAAEDKRRRNTAASARFRLKKKEREAALETRAKELESKVNELEKECEGLRRENGWLKGLVVGVTGAAAQGQVQVGVGTNGSGGNARN